MVYVNTTRSPIYNQATGSKSYSSILYYVYCMYYSICMELACLPKQANQSTLYTIQQLRSPFDLDQVKNVWRQSIFMFAQTPHTMCLNKVLGSIQ